MICYFCVYWLGGSSRWEAAEKCVRQQLCILVSTLGCQVFGWLINSSIFLEMRAAPSKVGWMTGLIRRDIIWFSPDWLPIIYVTHIDEDSQSSRSWGAFGQTVLRTVLLEFSDKNCPSPGEPFHFAFAHKSGTLIGTDVTQPTATVTCYCSAALNNKTREK